MERVAELIDTYLLDNTGPTPPAWSSGGHIGFFDLLLEVGCSVRDDVVAGDPAAGEIYAATEALSAKFSANASKAQVIDGAQARPELLRIAELARRVPTPA